MVRLRPTTAVRPGGGAPSASSVGGHSVRAGNRPHCPEADKTPCSEGRETKPDSPSDEQQASYSSERDACGHHFLYENQQREANDPNQVHYASIEQEGHQEPTTA